MTLFHFLSFKYIRVQVNIVVKLAFSLTILLDG